MYQTTKYCNSFGAFDAPVYKQLFIEIRDMYRDYIPVYTYGSWDGNPVAGANFPMGLSNSSSIFTAKVWATIKALKQMKDSMATKFIISTHLHSCLQALQYMKLEYPSIGIVIQK